MDSSYSDQFVYAVNRPVIEEPKLDIRAIIISKTQEFNISSDLLLRIVECESGFKPNIKNPRSTASGLFQFLTSTFLNYAQAYGLPTDDKNDPEVQIELAVRMIADGGLHHWDASRACWQNY